MASASRAPQTTQILQPLLTLAAAIQTQWQTGKSYRSADSPARLPDEALADLRAALQSLTPDQRAAARALSSNDDDGLTNTQETWWCTDPLNADSDGDVSRDTLFGDRTVIMAGDGRGKKETRQVSFS